MSDKVLVLRTCATNMTSYNGFRWPESGPVECPDWDPTPLCGRGLHGALWGEGDGKLLSWDPGAKWLVVEVDTADVVELGGKVKFPRGHVVYCGDRAGATALIQRPGRAVIGGTATAGNYGTATAGDHGTATAGDHGTATAGEYGAATSGYHGTATAGEYGAATSGYRGTATAGEGGTATAGNYGTATAGDHGTATAGEGGTATAGNYGTATAGDHGTATAGEYGTATAGEGGVVEISWWDGRRCRRVVGYVGEDGVEANVPYSVDERGQLIRKPDAGK